MSTPGNADFPCYSLKIKLYSPCFYQTVYRCWNIVQQQQQQHCTRFLNIIFSLFLILWQKQSQELTRVNLDRNIFSINVELRSTCLLYRDLVHHHHRILNWILSWIIRCMWMGSIAWLDIKIKIGEWGWLDIKIRMEGLDIKMRMGRKEWLDIKMKRIERIVGHQQMGKKRIRRFMVLKRGKGSKDFWWGE